MIKCPEHCVVKACFFLFFPRVLYYTVSASSVCEVLFVLWSAVKGMMGHGVCECGESERSLRCYLESRPLSCVKNEAKKKGEATGG